MSTALAKIFRPLFALAGIAGIVLVAYVGFFRTPSQPPPEAEPQREPALELERYMSDRMDYGLDFSRVLVEKRIEAAKEIAGKYPSLRTEAQAVVDSLQNRLARKAVMP